MALGSLGWLLLRLGTREGPPAARSRPAPAPESASGRNGNLAQSPQALAESSSQSAPELPAEPTSEEAPTLHGTLVIVGRDGEVEAVADGSFQLVLWRGERSEYSPKIRLEKGHWRSDLTLADLQGAELWVMNIQAGNRTAYLDRKSRFQLPQDLVLEIEARGLDGVRVKVVGEDSRADLVGMTVVAPPRRGDRLNHPGAYSSNDILLEDRRSPVVLPWQPEKGNWQTKTMIVHVCAPGYAWGRLELDFTSGAERILVLPPGGAVEVTLENYQPPPEAEEEATIRIREAPFADAETLAILEESLALQEKQGSEDKKLDDLRALLWLARNPRDLVAVAAADPRPIVLEGIAAGRYVVQAEVGDTLPEPLVLGAAPVEVTAGAREAVRLALKDRPASGSKAPLEGTLVFPEEWENRNIAIDFKLMDRPEVKTGKIRVELQALQPAAGHNDLYRWSAGLVVPGKYLATIERFQLQTIVDVGPEGRRDAEIRIGAPTAIEVRVVDAESGEAARVERLWWNCSRAKGSGGGGRNRASPGDGPGVFTLQAPAGEIWLEADADGYEQRTEHVTARPLEKNLYTLKLKRSCGLLVTVREGEEALPSGLLEKAIGVWDRTGSSVLRSSSVEDKGLRLRLEGPGTYKVTIDKLPGYQPVEPVTVEVPPGKFVEHEVMLRREHDRRPLVLPESH